MVGIRKNFNKSFKILKKNKVIIIPVLCMILIPLILFSFFLSSSGLGVLLKDVVVMNEERNQQNIEKLFNGQALLDEDTVDSGYDWNKFGNILTPQNITLCIGFVLISLIIIIYFESMTYLLIKFKITNIKFTIQNLIKNTNHFFFKILFKNFLFLFIFSIPLIGIIWVIFTFYVNILLGVFSIILFALLAFLYTVFMSLKLLFVIPMIFLDDKSVIESIKYSFDFTRKHLKKVLLIYVMIYGLTFLMNNFMVKPATQAFLYFIFANNWFILSINFILILIFVILEAFAIIFLKIFLFYAYIDYKKMLK